MTERNITENIVELIADEGKLLTDGKTANKKVMTNALLKGNWKEIPESEWVEPTEDNDYKERVIARVREKYSVDDELALLRQRDTKTEEYQEYFDYVEMVKAEEKAK